MSHRLLKFLFACAFLAVAAMRVQAQTPQMPPGLVLVAKIKGTVTTNVNGVTTALKVDDQVPQRAKINTGPDSDATLVFSNGVTVSLGAETELVLEEFLQKPFLGPVTVASMKEEPSTSRTNLALNRGKATWAVVILKIAQGSSFVIQTPVGAVETSGGIFRTVFRVEGLNLSRFQLSVVDGDARLTKPTSLGTASGAEKPLVIPAGQEIDFPVEVTANEQAQRVVSPPPNEGPPVPSADQDRTIRPPTTPPRK